MAIKLDPLRRGVIFTDFPLNPSANLRLRARRDFFRGSACIVFFCSFSSIRKKAGLWANEDHNYGIPK